MNPYVAAARRESEALDVPGTPRSLRLDDVEVIGDGLRLSWSFADPNVLPGDPVPHGRRIRGELEVPSAHGVPTEAARSWWAEAQLAAARSYKVQIDADWIPGEPYVRRVWTPAEAWAALLAHLGRYGDEVRVEGGVIHVVGTTEETIYRIDPDEWAAHLTDPETAWSPGAPIVPVAFPLLDGLPLWATDELDEAAGAWGPVVGLVDGRLVGLQVDDD